MAQQPQTTSSYVYGPANGGGDIFHFEPSSANATAGKSFLGWVDANNLTQGLSGVSNALSGGGPAAIAAAAASTAVFSTVPLNLPGGSAYEGIPFTVKASGWVTLNGGTYTATVQPFIYASTSSGFTASVAAAVLSTAATSLTIAVAAAATLTNFPWEAEITLFGNTSSGVLSGKINAGAVTVGPSGAIAPAPLPAAPAAPPNANLPTGVNFAAAVPLQFLAGVGLIGATISASNVTLQSFFLES